MKNWKEKASELGQWFQGQDVSIRYLIRFIVLALVIIAWNIINIHFNSFKIDDTSAHYLLSALVQSLAAIIAIVVTLTLVAVQLTASAYSPRVIDVFKKDWVMWLLLVWYGLSIFFGLFVLEMIGGTHSNYWCIIVPLEILVLLVYLMGIAAFAGLFWHIGNVIDLLKPENIIKRLSENITRENVLEHIKSVEENKKDPIQPIVDIIHDAVMKYDLATTRIGLKAVTDRVVGSIDSNSDSNSQKKISSCFCEHLGRVGRLTASKMDEESTREVIENLRNFGRFTAKEGFEGAAREAARFLGDVGKASAGQGLRGVAKSVAWHLGSVGKAAAKNKLKDATSQAARSLGVVGKAAAEKELEDAACEVAKSLREIGMTAAEKGFENSTLEVVNSLGAVGIAVAKRGLINVAFHIVEFLGQIGMAAAKNELIHAPQRAAKCLAHIGKIAAERGGEFEAVTIQAIESIGDIGKQEDMAALCAGYLIRVGETTVKQKLKNETWEVVKSIGQVGMAAAENEDVAENVITSLDSYLSYIERSAGGTELAEWAIKKAAQFLIEIGVVAIEHDRNDAAQKHAKCFLKWTRSYSEWDVNDLFIEWATSGRCEPLRKFREICEELRTQTPHNTSQQ